MEQHQAVFAAALWMAQLSGLGEPSLSLLIVSRNQITELVRPTEQIGGFGVATERAGPELVYPIFIGAQCRRRGRQEPSKQKSDRKRFPHAPSPRLNAA